MEQEKFSWKQMTWKQMTWKQRFQYFMDYYFKITVVIIIILCMVISFIKTVFFDRKETMLSVMVLNDTMDFDTETVEEDLKQRMGWTDEDQEVSFTSLTMGSYENEVVLITRLQARSVDVMISDRETFDKYAKKGFYDVVKKYLPEDMDLEEYLVAGRVEDLNDAGEVIAQGEELAYGLDLSTSGKYKELGGILQDPVIGVIVNGENLDAAGEMIAYLME